MTAVRPARGVDEARWRALWTNYCAFYHASVTEAVTADVWARIVAGEATRAAVAERDGQVIGFANYIIHPKTWDRRPVCYLEDLFVMPAARGTGAGAALIDWLLAECRRQDWCQLYWVTERGNATARKLYDRYAPADDFVRYRLKP